MGYGNCIKFAFKFHNNSYNEYFVSEPTISLYIERILKVFKAQLVSCVTLRQTTKSRRGRRSVQNNEVFYGYNLAGSIYIQRMW